MSHASGLPGQVEQDVALALTAGPGLRKGAEAGGPWWGAAGCMGLCQGIAGRQTDTGHFGTVNLQLEALHFRVSLWGLYQKSKEASAPFIAGLVHLPFMLIHRRSPFSAVAM